MREVRNVEKSQKPNESSRKNLNWNIRTFRSNETSQEKSSTSSVCQEIYGNFSASERIETEITVPCDNLDVLNCESEFMTMLMQTSTQIFSAVAPETLEMERPMC